MSSRLYVRINLDGTHLLLSMMIIILATGMVTMIMRTKIISKIKGFINKIQNGMFLAPSLIMEIQAQNGS